MSVRRFKKRTEVRLGGYVVSDVAMSDFRGLFPAGTEGDLDGMLTEATRISHGRGNLRYDDILFDERNGIIQAIGLVSTGTNGTQSNLGCPTCGGRGYLVFYDECSICIGEGCDNCDEGLVRVQRTCPETGCVAKKKGRPQRAKRNQPAAKRRHRENTGRAVPG